MVVYADYTGSSTYESGYWWNITGTSGSTNTGYTPYYIGKGPALRFTWPTSLGSRDPFRYSDGDADFYIYSAQGAASQYSSGALGINFKASYTDITPEIGE